MSALGQKQTSAWCSELAAAKSWETAARKRLRVVEIKRKPVTLPRVSIQHLAIDQ
jgi:hypothetical protein